MDFYQGAINIGTVTTSPYSYTWTSVASGSYALTVKATDNLGLATTSSAVTVIVGQRADLQHHQPGEQRHLHHQRQHPHHRHRGG